VQSQTEHCGSLALHVPTHSSYVTSDPINDVYMWNGCRFTGPAYITYKIEAEKFTGSKVSRVQFKEAASVEDGFFLELPLTLFASGELCRQHTAYINVRLLGVIIIVPPPLLLLLIAFIYSQTRLVRAALWLAYRCLDVAMISLYVCLLGTPVSPAETFEPIRQIPLLLTVVCIFRIRCCLGGRLMWAQEPRIW